MTPSSPTLATTRWLGHFVDPATERAFRAWQVQQALSFARSGLVASLVNWIALSLLLPVAAPDTWLRGLTVLWAVQGPLIWSSSTRIEDLGARSERQAPGVGCARGGRCSSCERKLGFGRICASRRRSRTVAHGPKSRSFCGGARAFTIGSGSFR